MAVVFDEVTYGEEEVQPLVEVTLGLPALRRDLPMVLAQPFVQGDGGPCTLAGSCGHCGRTLTNEESRARGIGPICAGKMGW